MVNVLADIGKQFLSSALEGLYYAIYAIDYIIPIVRCQTSDDNVRKWTATATYEATLAELEHDKLLKLVPDNCVFFTQNMTFKGTEAEPASMSDLKSNAGLETTRDQIGYNAMLDNIITNVVDLPDYWIAISYRSQLLHLPKDSFG